MAEPNPTEVSPWYLRNITQALELNSATGQVFVRTNASIVGNVSVGNVAIGSLGNVDITGNTLPVTISSGNVTVYQGDDPWNIAGNVGILGNVNVTQGTSPWTVSGNVGISGFANSISGTANVVYVQDQSSYQLNVGQTSGDSVIRETLKPFPYQPGKSQLTLNTFCFETEKLNLRQRVGLFDANDGVYFENDGQYNYFVIRSGSTGVEERVRQDAWNVDRLNPAYGLNPSGYTLYPNRTQIMFADVEWLGVGSVRVGFVINGAYQICHIFNHANQPGNTKVYMTTATLPIRYEITNTANTTSVSQMTQICSTVISEGGFQLTGSGNPRAASHAIGSPRVLPNDNSFLPVISIRLKSTNLNAVVIPINYSLVPVAASIFQFRIYKKAITSGGTWVDSAADSLLNSHL